MSIQDEQELLSLKAAGRIVRMVLDAMKAEVRSGVTTQYLDEIGARVMRENEARSAPSIEIMRLRDLGGSRVLPVIS